MPERRHLVLDTTTTTIRDAGATDHESLMALEGSAPHAGAALLQARRDFFARPRAYAIARTLVAERRGELLGVACGAITEVTVAGSPCRAGYIFNVRVRPDCKRSGLGDALMAELEEWFLRHGVGYFTGLIKSDNRPSLGLVTSRGWAELARIDYLVLDLGRFDPAPEADVHQLSVPDDLAEGIWDFLPWSHRHFAPRTLERAMRTRPPLGGCAGTIEAVRPGGRARLSLWDDRMRRGLDTTTFPVVKSYDLRVSGTAGTRALSAVGAHLAKQGLRNVLLPVPHDDPLREWLAPATEESIEFTFVVRPVNGAEPVPPGPVYFDIRH